MEIFRNLWRRKVRTSLTVIGIVMGIFALTTMGAMAEHFDTLIGGGITYYGNSIQVADDKGSSFAMGGSLMDLSTAARIAKVPGVAAVFPEVMVDAKPGSTDVMSFGIPDYIANWDPAENRYSAFKMSLAQGSWVDDASRGQVDLGSSMASEFHMKVGDSIYLPVRPSDAKPDFVNHRFTVVGIINQTLTAPDSGAYVSLHDAQMIQGDSLSTALTGGVDPYQVVSGAVAYGKSGVNLDTLANRITDQVPTVKATKPSTLVNSFKAGGAVFTFMTTAAAMLALIIGGLSVVNTMLMSVSERVREIGLKKAIGARTRHILSEFLAEAALIGLIGGVVGYLLGLALTTLLDGSNPSGGLFLVTPASPPWPSASRWRWARWRGCCPPSEPLRMDPVRALRAQ